MWSLFFEMVFSIALVILFRASSRVLFLICVASFILMGLAASMKGGFNLGGGYPGFPAGFPRSAMSLCGGVLLYRIHDRVSLPGAPPALLLAILFVILAMPGTTAGTTWLLDLLTVSTIFPFLILVAAKPSESRPLSTLLGGISYPVYLVHVPVITVVVSLRLGASVPEYYLAAGVLFVVCVVSFILLKTYDEPVRRWLGGARQRLPAASAP